MNLTDWTNERRAEILKLYKHQERDHVKFISIIARTEEPKRLDPGIIAPYCEPLHFEFFFKLRELPKNFHCHVLPICFGNTRCNAKRNHNRKISEENNLSESLHSRGTVGFTQTLVP